MTHCLIQIALLANSARWESMGNGFRGSGARFESGDMVTGALILAGALLGIFALSRFLSRQDRRRLYNSPGALFRNLAKAHGLNWSSRRLLRKLARSQQLTHPARIFLEPHRFAPENVSPQLRGNLSQLIRISERLFG